MARNKVVINGQTYIDLTDTTATADKILQGYGAYGANGEWMDGTAGFRILDFINDKSTSTSDSVGFGYGVNVSTMAAAGFTSSKKQTRSVSILKGSYIIFIQCKIEYGNFTVTSNSEGFSFLTEYANSSTTWRKCYFINSSFPVTGGTITVSPSQDPFPENVSTEPLSVTVNGTYTAPSGTAYTPVTVNVPTPTPSLQTKSVSPSETAQTVTPDSGYDGLSQVSVGAISNTYVGSGITRRSSSDLTASGATVTAPAGYYAEGVSKVVASGTEGTPTATKGTVSNHSVTVTPSVTNTAGYIAGGTKSGTGVNVTASELVSGTLEISQNGTGIDVTNYAAVDVNVSGGGGVTIVEEPDAGGGTIMHIVAGDTVRLQAKTVTPTESVQTVEPDTGYNGLSEVEVGAISSTYVGTGVTRQAAATITPSESQQTAVAANTYTTGAVTVGAISSTYVGSGITRRSSTDLTASGATVSVPAGYYASAGSKAVASGSEGTPTATKGAVSNHAVTVTPSVTNTAGYISGGTKSGTGVTVQASELVSGSETKTANGTYNVTNLASLVVAIPFSTIYTGSSDPPSTIGVDGDIYLKVVT